MGEQSEGEVIMKYEDLKRVNSEITTTPIKGKNYAEVPQRVQAFRKLYPEGSIETELISNENGVCVFKATASFGGVILGTGHAYEKENSSFINKTSYIENCETSAVGRALGFLGIGSETTMASYEEVANAQLQQETAKTISKKEQEILLEIWTEAGGTEQQLLEHCKVKALKEITSAQFGKVMAQLQEKEDGK